MQPAGVGALLDRTQVPQLLEESDANIFIHQTQKARGDGQTGYATANDSHAAKFRASVSLQFPKCPNEIVRTNLLTIDGHSAF